MKNEKIVGHLAALLAIAIWGLTFISTKVLLDSFSPVEILVIRFVIGYICLWIVHPHVFRLEDKRQEIYYVICGLFGVTLYYMLESVALTYTFASNVGVIISTAPFFTAVAVYLLMRDDEQLRWTFFLGFVIALGGIAMISYNGTNFSVSPLGDGLTILAAFMWAFYSVSLKKINTFGYATLPNTRRIFFWGLVFMIPMAGVLGFHPQINELMRPVNYLNLLFLGAGACALCFVVWNFAVKAIGAIKTSVYIYLDPIITLVASAIILSEPVTGLMLVGTALTLLGLAVSEYRPKAKK